LIQTDRGLSKDNGRFSGSLSGATVRIAAICVIVIQESAPDRRIAAGEYRPVDNGFTTNNPYSNKRLQQ